MEINEFSNCINNTRDYFFSNEIYISEELATKVEFILNDFQSTITQFIMKIEFDNKEIDYPYGILDKIELELKYIRMKIKNELAIADYDVNK